MSSPRIRIALWLVDRAERLPATSRVRRAALGFAAVLVACAFLVVAPHAGAQRSCPDVGEDLTLARLTWHEAGVTSLVDASAIHSAIAALSEIRDETWHETVCAYSGRALRGETRRTWISLLDDSGLAPVGWPERASWSVQGALWRRLRAHTALVVAGEADAACDRPPTDWGDPELDSGRIERGVARGYWSRVRCTGTVNVYLRRTAADAAERERIELGGGR